MVSMQRDIVKRYFGNPILTRTDIPYPVETVHNAAVVKHNDEYIMLFRSHLRTGRSIIGLARSRDGFHFVADPQPFLTPVQTGRFARYEEFGVEDPRVTKVDDEYLITYSVLSCPRIRSPFSSKSGTRFFVPGSVKYQQSVCFQCHAEPCCCRRCFRFLAIGPLSYQMELSCRSELTGEIQGSRIH